MHDKRIALVLREAWKVHRLDVIRMVVQQTIDELSALKAHDLLGRDTLQSEESEGGPVRAAFEACRHELREGCGIAEPDPTVALMPPNGPLASPWVHSYSNALGRYRDIAYAALQASLESVAGSVPAAKAAG
jgi:hypothetical protein